MTKKGEQILIASIEEDQSTSDVVDWLLKKQQKFVRLNSSKELNIKILKIDNNEISFNIKSDERIISKSDIKSFWYRKGVVKIKTSKLDDNLIKFKWYFDGEVDALKTFLIHELDKIAPVNKLYNSNVNKLVQLAVASKCKLNIPETIITSDKASVQSFIQNKPIITKSIQLPFIYADNKNINSLLTSEYNLNDLKKSSQTFFYTKFQTNIIKKLELRIFYLDRKFYSMAIFSQTNSKTKIDFRNYDTKRPNRCVPFTLNDEIKNKLHKLMKRLDLASGSIDMLVDEKNNYYFLEVNPVGQFGMVSIPCNYYLEKKVAELIQK